ncbi:hypothetical protein M409DRAFT_60960 [Zasmidium cellare ATCC 36951]|uniref:Uncharacterized protein n=1 Tax=Zasmidium cellare ATCC 36951 TaxID=1080233 RepID=A0A6A6C0M8_ZASCE|nr:uncharacterized protein M409DRAFT_60960 [Zasmidium cellare ATCC 36951]KAF2159256.1 hypothetical protein M409DRAFT_60960 [Zasmidium cellare ATCC 36951]
MKYSSVIAALATLSQGLGTRETGCCFHLDAFGDPSGPVVQLDDGQNRIEQDGLPEGQYCLTADGGLTDAKGRGCILTPPTTQWQCDAGASPTPGFSITSDGTLSYHDDTTFYACPSNGNKDFNIYDQPVENQQGCVPIWLQADNCQATPPAPEPTPPPPTSKCPRDLPAVGDYEFPHLIIPIDSANPKTCYGTQYNGSAHGTISSIFNFDIPTSTQGKTCSIQFLFPEQSTLETSAYTYSGDGVFKFAILNGPASEWTTFETSPKVVTDYGSFSLSPGNAYDIASIPCPAGQAIGIWFHTTGNGVLDFFQDYNPCPIGVYVVPK